MRSEEENVCGWAVKQEMVGYERNLEIILG